MRGFITVLTGCVLCTTPALAGGMFLSDNRSLDASYTYDDGSGPQSDGLSYNRSDFALIDETVEITPPSGGPAVTARATQTSSYGSMAIQASGSAFAQAFVSPFMSASLASSSVFSTTFSIAAATGFTLEVELAAGLDENADSFPNGGASVLLTGPGGSAVSQSLTNFDGEVGGPLIQTFTGTLTIPGTYTLTAQASQDLSVATEDTMGEGLSSYDIDLSLSLIPEPSAGLCLLLGAITLASARRRA